MRVYDVAAMSVGCNVADWCCLVAGDTLLHQICLAATAIKCTLLTVGLSIQLNSKQLIQAHSVSVKPKCIQPLMHDPSSSQQVLLGSLTATLTSACSPPFSAVSFIQGRRSQSHPVSIICLGGYKPGLHLTFLGHSCASDTRRHIGHCRAKASFY